MLSLRDATHSPCLKTIDKYSTALKARFSTNPCKAETTQQEKPG